MFWLSKVQWLKAYPDAGYASTERMYCGATKDPGGKVVVPPSEGLTFTVTPHAAMAGGEGAGGDEGAISEIIDQVKRSSVDSTTEPTK
jgi:hypothetical protein